MPTSQFPVFLASSTMNPRNTPFTPNVFHANSHKGDIGTDSPQQLSYPEADTILWNLYCNTRQWMNESNQQLQEMRRINGYLKHELTNLRTVNERWATNYFHLEAQLAAAKRISRGGEAIEGNSAPAHEIKDKQGQPGRFLMQGAHVSAEGGILASATSQDKAGLAEVPTTATEENRSSAEIIPLDSKRCGEEEVVHRRAKRSRRIVE
jgi:hypothetical protein